MEGNLTRHHTIRVPGRNGGACVNQFALDNFTINEPSRNENCINVLALINDFKSGIQNHIKHTIKEQTLQDSKKDGVLHENRPR
jgi:hypothetical protein